MPATGKPEERLPRRRILRGRKTFATLKREGFRVAGPHLALNWMRVCAEASQEPKMAVIVPKAVGSAVERNRVRRRLREIYRRIQAGLPKGWCGVWIVRRGATALDYSSLRQEALELLARAGKTASQ